MYTNVKQYGNNILYRGIHNGTPIQKKVPYKPSLFVPTNEHSSYKTLYGENLKKIDFKDIKSAKDFVKQHEDIENFKIYGNTKYEYCLISDLYKKNVKWDINNIRIAIFDIEVNSDPETGGFASPQDPTQPIISIALKFLNESKFYLFGCEEFDAPDDVIYIKCKDEWTLLKKFIEIWSIKYPDIYSGWLSEGFDIIYLINRCNKILGESETRKLSPWGIIFDKKTRKFNPKFNRYEEEVSYSIIGISSLDYIDLYKKYQPGGMSKESYKLDYICSEEINEHKTEFEGSLHNLYTSDKQKFYEYNVQDVRLVENLDNKCKLFELALTLAYYTKTNYEDIYHQTRLGDALCFNSLREQNIQIPTINKNEFTEFKGAFVKPPITGLYKWIATIDAASLYPSSIVTFNISPETLVDSKDYTQSMRGILQNNISVETILKGEIDLSSLKKDNVCLTPNGQFFRRDKKGFIPAIVEKLFNERKLHKKKMLTYQNQFETEIDEHKKKELLGLISKYNALQNSLKLVANSIYGSLGNAFFRWYDVRLAEAITLCGQTTNRWVIENVNNYLNSLLGLNKDYVLSSDSITHYTPIYISYIKGNNRLIDIITIDELAEKYGNNNWIIDARGKEFCELENIYSWSDSGWIKIHRVIRHKLLPHKKIIRILTHTGCVDVTDDHSLLLPNKEKISPKNAFVGMELLHNNVPVFDVIYNSISKEEAQILGFFFGDGSCGEYLCKCGKKSTWAINNSSFELLTKYKLLCEKAYPEFNWVIMDTIKSSGVYKLSPRVKTRKGRRIIDFVKECRQKMYSKKAKVIPLNILHSSDDIKKAFWEGLYDADGDKRSKYLRIDQKHQLSASHIFLLASSLGHFVRINSRIDKQKVFSLGMVNSFDKHPNLIKKSFELDYSGYVYDLTTENNHFAAGVGKLIVHNTDSLIITLQDIIEKYIPTNISDEKIIKMVKKIADQKIQPEVDNFCKRLFDYCNVATPSISYKLEKICSSGVFVAKKRYALNVYSNEGVIYAKPKVKVTGLEIVKSSTPAVVKQALRECVNIILNENETQLQNFVNNFKNLFLKFSCEEIAFPRSANGISKYSDENQLYKKGTPINVRGSLLYNKLIKEKGLDSVYEYIKDGDKIKYCYLKLPNPLKENIISFPEKLPKEFAFGEFIDYNTMFEKSFMKPLRSISDVIGWELEQRNTIDRFF